MNDWWPSPIVGILLVVLGASLAFTSFLASSRISELESRVELLERASHPEMPTVVAYCVEGEANGPPEVPLRHPVLEISGKTEGDTWLEIAIGRLQPRYLVMASSGPTPHYWGKFDGWISSIRGDTSYHILAEGNRYILRGWREPYTEGMPTLKDLLFEKAFTLPGCNG